MMKPAAFLLLLAAAISAPAQVTLSTVQGSTASPAGSAYDFGTLAVGTSADAIFRLTNTGSQGVYLTGLFLPPQPFSVVCSLSPDLCGAAPLQQLPILIGPGGTLDFTIQFQPLSVFKSTNVTMTINAGNMISITLIGSSVPGLSALLNNQPLASGQLVSFGDVQVGSSQSVKLMLANDPSNPPLAVPAISQPSTQDFTVSGPALGSPTVAAGSSVELDIIFKPTATGLRQGTLTIGLLSLLLQGTGTTPPPPVFPTPSIQINLSNPASAQQGSLSVTLASAAPVGGAGTVTLSFQPSISGVSDDPTVTFADGTRTAAFTVAQGSSAAQFAGAATIAFATGTTTGTLSFNLTLGANNAQATVTVAPAVVGIDAAVAARNVACDVALLYCTASNIELEVNGWDNTHSVSQLVFTFFNAHGATISPGSIAVDASSAFQTYFTSSTLGGVFGVHALFPVNGDSNQVTAAQVKLVNSAGAAQSTQISF